ncbi:MAG: thiamine pyrophosphate-dependent enzyme [Acetobacteraceae bacterium]|nr:thiamine pyrophosphate-dependent enzyme [Acetobacteraceae bacterium]
MIEEKRSLVKRQARDILYNLPADRRPAVVGKRTLAGEPLLPEYGELDPVAIARALARVLPEFGVAVSFAEPDLPPTAAALTRAPYFCAGCPHNTSTVVPEGALALGGIGCHTLALGAVGRAKTVTHMGAEGVTWAGLAPFVEVPHAFVNMGDGTYQHSGILAIRQAVAAGANVTYKILYNSAVAMTGGQPVDGGPSVAQIVRQLAAEGVARIAVVADDASRLPRRLRAAARRRAHDARAPAGGPGTLPHRSGSERDRLRPDLRHREAAQAQARHDGCAEDERSDQRARVRELRRLHGAVELCGDRAGGDRVRPQAPCLSLHLQHRPLLPQGFLPVLRHRRRGAQAEGTLDRDRGDGGAFRARIADTPSPAAR